MRQRLSLLLLALATLGQTQALKVGDTAQIPSGLRYLGPTPPAFQKGRVTVLEFWATWCAPCVAAFPHLNALAEETKGDPVTFVSVTSDPETKALSFLKAHPLRTAVALDPDERAFRLYGAFSIPHTVVIGLDGTVAAVTRPERLSAEILRNVAAGRDPGLAKTDAAEPSLTWDREAGLLTDAALGLSILQPSKATEASRELTNPVQGRIVADGADVRKLLVLAYGAEESPVRGSVPADAGRYRVSVKAPDKSLDTARAMLRAMVERAFPYAARWEAVEREAPTLRRTKGTLRLTPSSAERESGYAGDGRLSGKGVTLSWLARRLGMRVSDVAAQDDTGVRGRYDVTLEWDPSDPAGLQRALAPLGLEIVMVRRKVPTLFVGPAPKRG